MYKSKTTMTSAWNTANIPLGIFDHYVSEVKLPGDQAKQNNLPPECGQPIDGVKSACFFLSKLCSYFLAATVP
jgi:hypothetical protein